MDWSWAGVVQLDGNLTWNSSWPQFTDCFQKVATTGGPCALLWLTSLVYGFYLMTLKDDAVPTGRVTTLRKTCSTLLALVSLCELTFPHHPEDGIMMDMTQFRLTAHTFAPLTLLLTVMLCGMLTRLEQQKGLRSSAVLFIFWLLLSFCQSVPLYTMLMDQMYVTQPVASALFLGKVALILSLVVLHGLAEAPLTLPPPGEKKPCPDHYQHLWSRVTFSWVNELVKKGKEGTISEKELFDQLPGQKSRNVQVRFDHYWQQEVDKAKRKNQATIPDNQVEDLERLLDQTMQDENGRMKRIRLHRAKSMEVPKNTKQTLYTRCQSETAPFREFDSLSQTGCQELEAGEEMYEEKKEDSQTKTGSRAKPNFLTAMLKCFGVEFAINQLMNVSRTVVEMIDPLLLGMFLKYLEDDRAPKWWGYVLCGAMLLNRFVRIIQFSRSDFANHHFATRIKNSIASSVYQKALTMDTESRQESTVGQAVNLLSVDTMDICRAFTWMTTEILCVPVRVIASLIILYQLLGPSMLLGVLILVIMIPVNSVIARKLSGFHKKIMELKDARLKLFTEVINGVKILKMFAWEPSFIEKVNEARKKEMDMIWWRSVWDTAMHFYWAVSPYMVSLTMFLMYVYSSEDHYLSPSVAFVALSLMTTLKNNMGVVPHIISHFVKVKVSFNRLNEFLGRNDLEDNISSDKDDALSIQGGFFTWNTGAAPILKNINLSVKKGSLVAVVGTVGCGKSSLLSACLGEMRKLKGQVSVKGSVAYVPQQAWIQHATLKDNVLFGQELDEELYQRCLDDCALRPDLEILPGGDRTEIGEKGINLSGGQKQRVSLARAAYSQADVYLFDDPLSAVDCHVGSHIFDKVVGHQGMLAGKTRVLVTHGVQWLPKVDQIIVIKHGRVSETGTYDELLTHNGPFAKFLKSYLVHNKETESSDPMMERMKADILHRLESIPSVKSHSSVPNDDSHYHVSSGSESTSSNNDSIVQELMSSMGLEHDKQPQESEQEDGSADDLDRSEECEEEQNTRNPGSQKKGTLDEEEEDYKVKQVDWGTLKIFAQVIGNSWIAVILVLILAQHSADRASDLSLSAWTDDPKLTNLTLLPKDSPERASLNNRYLMVYASLGMIHAIATMIFRIITMFRRVVMARSLHHRMLSRVLRAPMSFFDTTPSGRIVTRFSSDLTMMDTNLMETMEIITYMVCASLGKFLVICYATPAFILAIIPTVFIFRYTQKYFSPSMRAMERLESKTKGPIYSFFSETLAGTVVIRAYKAQQRFLREFQRRYDLHHTVILNWVCCNKWLHVRIQFIMYMVLTSVTLIAVAYKDTVSSGIIGLAVFQASDITFCLHRLVHMTGWLQTQLVSVDRVQQYCTLKTEADWRKEDTKPSASWPENGEVEADGLAVRYREGLDLVLKGIDLRIRAGEKVGIVGRTGAGKSSLTLALFRLLEPERGEFRIDDVSINDLGLHDLRTRLTILPQDPVIFAGTLRMNLDPFAHFTDAEVWEAFRHAHLSDFVSGLKEGLKHECGEGGENLSVGQRQLLCLARTLLHKTRVLVLDEATAAVDMETDDLIQKTIRSEFKECTVLTIAHRLNTVIDYDKILVLDKGQVVEFDSPTNLMDNPSSIFHDMCKKAGLLHKRPRS